MVDLINTNDRILAGDAALEGSAFEDVTLVNSRFMNVDLTGVQFADVNMMGVTIRDANLDGMTIDGIAVKDLFAAYRVQNG